MLKILILDLLQCRSSFLAVTPRTRAITCNHLRGSDQRSCDCSLQTVITVTVRWWCRDPGPECQWSVGIICAFDNAACLKSSSIFTSMYTLNTIEKVVYYHHLLVESAYHHVYTTYTHTLSHFKHLKRIMLATDLYLGDPYIVVSSISDSIFRILCILMLKLKNSNNLRLWWRVVCVAELAS